MKRFQFFQYAAAAIATLGFVLPSGVSAADASRTPVPASPAATPAISDVSLGEGGTLSGQVLDAQGAPLAKTIVAVRGSGLDVARVVTDTQGCFSVRGLQGGVYEVTSGGSSGVFRIWTAQASPPSASKGVLIVAGGPVSRGQGSGPRAPGKLTNGQIILAAAAATALVVGVVAWAFAEHQSAS